MLTSLALVFLVGLSMAAICQKIKLPRIIGMLITGIILGPFVLDLFDQSILGISADLRKMALVIILIKAGLSLNLKDLKKVGRPALLLAFLPATFELIAFLIFAPKILGITILEAAVMGAVLAANGLGGAVAAQIVSPIIYEEGNPFGFRNAYKLVALILTVVGIIIMVVFKEKSSDEPTAKAKKSRGKEWTGISFAQARKKPYFYIVLSCTFLSGLVLQGINGIASAHMKDVGLDASYIATVLSAHSLALAGFKFLTGIFYDKFGGRKTMLLCSVTATVVTLALAAVAPSPTGRIIAMLYGIFSSLALPLETVMLPLMTNDLFGSADFDHLLGLLVSFSTAGYAVGNPLVNLCFDMLGTYVPILYILSAVMLVVTVCYQLAFSFASRDKDRYICEAPTT